MVDVSAKPATRRTARAHAFVRIRPAVLNKLPENPKGNPLEIARIAGISAAKRTSELIPLCHPLALTHADVEVTVEKRGVRIVSSAATTGAHRRGDGSSHRRRRGRAHRLRHAQGAGQIHRDPGSLPAGKDRRQKRRVSAAGTLKRR